jgi:hypothetical protein
LIKTQLVTDKLVLIPLRLLVEDLVFQFTGQVVVFFLALQQLQAEVISMHLELLMEQILQVLDYMEL